MIGQAGLLEGLAIITLANVVTLITAISMSAVSTNGQIKGGGIYYMISRSLGKFLQLTRFRSTPFLAVCGFTFLAKIQFQQRLPSSNTRKMYCLTSQVPSLVGQSELHSLWQTPLQLQVRAHNFFSTLEKKLTNL